MNELNTQIELIVSEIIKSVRHAKTLKDLTTANTKGIEDITELVKKLTIPVVVNWLPFKEENYDEYNRLVHSDNCILKFDNGEELDFNSENYPFALVTHFRAKN